MRQRELGPHGDGHMGFADDPLVLAVVSSRDTLYGCIASITFDADTHRCTIDNATHRVDATNADARVYTFRVNARLSAGQSELRTHSALAPHRISHSSEMALATNGDGGEQCSYGLPYKSAGQLQMGLCSYNYTLRVVRTNLGKDPKQRCPKQARSNGQSEFETHSGRHRLWRAFDPKHGSHRAPRRRHIQSNIFYALSEASPVKPSRQAHSGVFVELYK
ncbi:unnamed protein product [Ceratitis capitata]|uniref:(Mediterranean fruit fly) hypothetical protein n=1 Tax=Ceratitis capitata TaxID=7213 RepID=A0A811UP92_CERCA|nr:unnamed protein product [Ceratitis capitata]